MERPARPYNRQRYEHETGGAQYWVREAQAFAENLRTDPQKQARLSKGKCPFCFYRRGTMAAQAMTNKPCDICEQPMRFGSSNVDAVCESCSEEYGICRHCGADINLKLSRTKFKEKNPQ